MFTSALFLSGYVVQQKTLRDIRAAIAPQPPPPMEARLYLPEQFKEHVPFPDDVTVGLTPDGNSHYPEDKGPIKDVDSQSLGVESGTQQAEQKPMYIVDSVQPAAELIKEAQTDIETSVESEEKKEEKRLSAAARRKKIKEEILAAGEGEGFKGYRRRMW